MEKKGSAQELGAVSSFFITTPEEKRGSSGRIPEPNGVSWGHATGNGCETEETVIMRRRMAYPNSRSSQENMQKNLVHYLQEGYAVSRIELRKITEKQEPGNRVVTTEEICMYLK